MRQLDACDQGSIERMYRMIHRIRDYITQTDNGIMAMERQEAGQEIALAACLRARDEIKLLAQLIAAMRLYSHPGVKLPFFDE